MDLSRAYIQEYINRARQAQKQYESFTQEQVDEIVKVIAKTVYDNAEYLAEMAVKETGMGVVEDKVEKNKNKSRMIYNSLKGKKSVGIIERDEQTGITILAKPMGVVAAITPCTNPIATTMSNSMFALKGKNVIIISPHHKAIVCSTKTVKMINAELKKIGAPADIIQILSQQSRNNTRNLMSMADVVVATGGMGIVHAAYSSGRPALGVGAGNVQCVIDRDADMEDAVSKIVEGRRFDNGILCASEQSVIIPADKFDEIMNLFKKNGAFIITDSDKKTAFRQVMFNDGTMSGQVVGKSVQDIATLAGVDIPSDAKIIIIEADGIGTKDVLSKEKMCPVLTAYRYDDFKDAVEIARANLEIDGKGHSVSIHSHNKANIEYAGNVLSVCRFLINQCCATSAGGSFLNGLAPTNTAGCGTWGHNSFSDNLTYKHLINLSRVAYYMKDNPVPTDEELWN
ncbi:MAG: aldehyde dehydrogenase family protein [Syntrophaceae bacterium]|nr:aldehyde dehydrogenase family protein [Syntrophaceae bacterium]